MNEFIAYAAGIATGGLLTGWALALRVVLVAATKGDQ